MRRRGGGWLRIMNKNEEKGRGVKNYDKNEEKGRGSQDL